MRIAPHIARVFALCAVLFVAACSTAHEPNPPEVQRQNIAELSSAILALGPDVSREEAERAAYVTYTYVDQLIVQYEIEDGPLRHNTKVNLGFKPRGLCYHWATDIENRLKAEKFETLEIHRAIANYDSLRLEHSTSIISARGDTMEEGLVLDPWRGAGELFWAPVPEDTRYNWTPQDEVFAFKRARKEGRL